ncbi:MAG TPA: hypothetical protein VMV43_03975, partial [Candidatus Nanopelagicaceae bacterium]|nr:hypothetical protein [Candidatus Nanopelagicaceae bacterium]
FLIVTGDLLPSLTPGIISVFLPNILHPECIVTSSDDIRLMSTSSLISTEEGFGILTPFSIKAVINEFLLYTIEAYLFSSSDLLFFL